MSTPPPLDEWQADATQVKAMKIEAIEVLESTLRQVLLVDYQEDRQVPRDIVREIVELLYNDRDLSRQHLRRHWPRTLQEAQLLNSDSRLCRKLRSSTRTAHALYWLHWLRNALPYAVGSGHAVPFQDPSPAPAPTPSPTLINLLQVLRALNGTGRLLGSAHACNALLFDLALSWARLGHCTLNVFVLTIELFNLQSFAILRELAIHTPLNLNDWGWFAPDRNHLVEGYLELALTNVRSYYTTGRDAYDNDQFFAARDAQESGVSEQERMRETMSLLYVNNYWGESHKANVLQAHAVLAAVDSSLHAIVTLATAVYSGFNYLGDNGDHLLTNLCNWPQRTKPKLSHMLFQVNYQHSRLYRAAYALIVYFRDFLLCGLSDGFMRNYMVLALSFTTPPGAGAVDAHWICAAMTANSAAQLGMWRAASALEYSLWASVHGSAVSAPMNDWSATSPIISTSGTAFGVDSERMRGEGGPSNSRLALFLAYNSVGVALNTWLFGGMAGNYQIAFTSLKVPEAARGPPIWPHAIMYSSTLLAFAALVTRVTPIFCGRAMIGRIASRETPSKAWSLLFDGSVVLSGALRLASVVTCAIGSSMLMGLNTIGTDALTQHIGVRHTVFAEQCRRERPAFDWFERAARWAHMPSIDDLNASYGPIFRAVVGFIQL